MFHQMRCIPPEPRAVKKEMGEFMPYFLVLLAEVLGLASRRD